MPKRTIILILVLIAAVAVLLAIALTPKKSSSPTPVPPATLPVVQTVLQINSPVSSKSAIASGSAASYTTDVTINTGTNKVTAVQLELSFDPKAITNVEIKPGPFLTNPIELLRKVDNQNGTISYALGAGVTGGKLQGIQGQGTVAVITFTEIGLPGSYTQINFLPKTLVTGEGTARSVLKSSFSTSFPIAGATTVLTPTAGAGTSSGRPIYTP